MKCDVGSKWRRRILILTLSWVVFLPSGSFFRTASCFQLSYPHSYSCTQPSPRSPTAGCLVMRHTFTLSPLYPSEPCLVCHSHSYVHSNAYIMKLYFTLDLIQHPTLLGRSKLLTGPNFSLPSCLLTHFLTSSLLPPLLFCMIHQRKVPEGGADELAALLWAWGCFSHTPEKKV